MKKIKTIFCFLTIFCCTSKLQAMEKIETITLGAGCFWCVEAVYEQIEGVKEAVSGYMGGKEKDASYEKISMGTTKHIECVQIQYNTEATDTETILKWFWDSHDPTQKNRQGNDIGYQYQSAIFHSNEQQKKIAIKSKKEEQKYYEKPITTLILPASKFYPAEKYHQDYYRQNKNKNPYCSLVIKPKLKKLNLKH